MGRFARVNSYFLCVSPFPLMLGRMKRMQDSCLFCLFVHLFVRIWTFHDGLYLPLSYCLVQAMATRLFPGPNAIQTLLDVRCLLSKINSRSVVDSVPCNNLSQWWAVYTKKQRVFWSRKHFYLIFVLIQKIDQTQGKAIRASVRVLCIFRDFLGNG